MKKNMFVISVATVVAICSLWSTSLAQDATREQVDAENKRVAESELQAKLSAQQNAERLSKLTPEQIALRELALERIKNMPRPPLPTNAPMAMKTLRSFAVKAPSKPTLSQGEKLRLRTDLMTSLYFDSMIGTQESADYLNNSIVALSAESLEPTTIVESAYALATVIGSEENQEQSLMMSARTVDYTSNPYVLINMAPFINGIQNAYPWYTSASTDLNLYWISTPRTLVPTNGPAARSGPFNYGQSGASALRNPTIINHYDTAGSPVRHILALNYKLENTSPVAGMDVAYIDIDIGVSGAVSTTNHVHYTLPPASTWTRNVKLINSMAKTNPLAPSQGIGVRYYEFWAVLIKNHYNLRSSAMEPVLTLDPSIQWIPYWLQPIPEDFIIEDVGNQAWVQWNTIAYPTNSFKLTFATSTLGPWSDQIGITVNYTNEVATAKFGTTNSMRYYRLQNR